MAEITSVNPQEMLSTAKSLADKIGEWNQKVGEIYKLQSELDYMWDGNANAAFNNQWADDKVKYDQLSQLMAEYCEAISTAANLYIQREEEVHNIVAAN